MEKDNFFKKIVQCLLLQLGKKFTWEAGLLYIGVFKNPIRKYCSSAQCSDTSTAVNPSVAKPTAY